MRADIVINREPHHSVSICPRTWTAGTSVRAAIWECGAPSTQLADTKSSTNMRSKYYGNGTGKTNLRQTRGVFFRGWRVGPNQFKFRKASSTINAIEW